MPKLLGTELVQAILEAFDESGASALLNSRPDRNPRRFLVQTERDTFELWAYIWTLTHGGGARDRDEFRIQMTGVASPLQLNPSGLTVLIGYEPGAAAFAGFDPTKHIMFTAGSPSVQVPIPIVHAALQDGFSFYRKSNDEMVIGFRPDQFLAYALNAVALHEQGVDVATVELLTMAASFQEIEVAELRQLPPERQRVVRVVSRLSREADFRRKVTIAYDRKCAVTRMQLRLVDAAHILSVGATGSTDEVSNGICLTPTYHRAFDRGLIYLDQDLVMRINPEQEATLIQVRLNGGISDFKTYLGKKIHLPADRRQWPDIELIRKSNEHRRIPL